MSPFKISLPIKIDNKNTNYSINDEGDIINLNTNKVLKQRINNSGYNIVDLYQDQQKKTYLVHRLVASTFIKNPENLPTVNHINGDKQCNLVENLEWCSYSENNQHAYDTGLHKKMIGEQCSSSKYDELTVRDICSKLENGMSSKQISSILGISKDTIEAIKCGNSWTHISNQYNIPEPRYRMPEETYLKIKELSLEGKNINEICKELDWECDSIHKKRITRAINR